MNQPPSDEELKAIEQALNALLGVKPIESVAIYEIHGKFDTDDMSTTPVELSWPELMMFFAMTAAAIEPDQADESNKLMQKAAAALNKNKIPPSVLLDKLLKALSRYAK